jgi:hypothetical protein
VVRAVHALRPLDATLEKRMITGQREPRLTFTLEEFSQVLAVELRKSMPAWREV